MKINHILNYDILSPRVKTLVFENRWLIFSAILLGIVSHGYGLFNFGLSIDEEIESFNTGSDSKIYILIGRWGTYWLNYIFSPHSVLPYYPSLIATLCISLTAILIASTEQGSLSSKILFSAIFISFPLHSYYLTFSTINLYYTAGMVLATVGYLCYKYSLSKQHTLNGFLLLSIALVTLALSIYQALMAVFIFLGVYHLFSRLMEADLIVWRDVLKKLAILGMITVISFIIYKVVDIGSRALLLGDLQDNTDYLDDFKGWGYVPIRDILVSLWEATIEYPFGFLYYSGFAGKALLIFLPILVIMILRKSITARDKFLMIIMLGILYLTPMTVMYLIGMPPPIRSFMAIPLLIALIWFIVYKKAKPLLQNIMLILMIGIFIHNTYINTRLLYSSYLSMQADRDMANRIIERIYSLDFPGHKEFIEVAFLGKYQHEANLMYFKTDVHGASFFEWDEGNPVRFYFFFKAIGINEIRIAPQADIKDIEVRAQDVPCWPSKGSVCLIDDIVVVKFSETQRK